MTFPWGKSHAITDSIADGEDNVRAAGSLASRQTPRFHDSPRNRCLTAHALVSCEAGSLSARELRRAQQSVVVLTKRALIP